MHCVSEKNVTISYHTDPFDICDNLINNQTDVVQRVTLFSETQCSSYCGFMAMPGQAGAAARSISGAKRLPAVS